LRPGLSGWDACTLAAAASEAVNEKNLHHGGAIPSQKRFPVIWQGLTSNGEKELRT